MCGELKRKLTEDRLTGLLAASWLVQFSIDIRGTGLTQLDKVTDRAENNQSH